MSHTNQKLLEDLLVAQVLTLAQAKKNEEKINGRNSTSNYIYEACREIENKRQDILEMLKSTQGE